MAATLETEEDAEEKDPMQEKLDALIKSSYDKGTDAPIRGLSEGQIVTTMLYLDKKQLDRDLRDAVLLIDEFREFVRKPPNKDGVPPFLDQLFATDFTQLLDGLGEPLGLIDSLLLSLDVEQQTFRVEKSFIRKFRTETQTIPFAQGAPMMPSVPGMPAFPTGLPEQAQANWSQVIYNLLKKKQPENPHRIVRTDKEVRDKVANLKQLTPVIATFVLWWNGKAALARLRPLRGFWGEWHEANSWASIVCMQMKAGARASVDHRKATLTHQAAELARSYMPMMGFGGGPVDPQTARIQKMFQAMSQNPEMAARLMKGTNPLGEMLPASQPEGGSSQ
jgi:hypothetical protein